MSTADRSAATVDRPAAAAKAQTARPVETLERAHRSGGALSAEVRSMLLSEGPLETGPAHSTRLIGELLDAIRVYDRPGR